MFPGEGMTWIRNVAPTVIRECVHCEIETFGSLSVSYLRKTLKSNVTRCLALAHEEQIRLRLEGPVPLVNPHINELEMIFFAEAPPHRTPVYLDSMNDPDNQTPEIKSEDEDDIPGVDEAIPSIEDEHGPISATVGGWIFWGEGEEEEGEAT
ncbi:hypothetical protein N0V85_005699 [Neurospora sp. IMI 360204]|nr:hypothetical protein N0V85_005699 [Neurospora sp. IMI 360204]